MAEHKQEHEKKKNGFASVLKKIFVHNFGWKVLSIVSAAVIWALATGLAGLV